MGFIQTLALLLAVSQVTVAANEGDPADVGPAGLRGEAPSIRRGWDTFEFVYRVEIPALEQRASLWLPFASSDAFQEVVGGRRDQLDCQSPLGLALGNDRFEAHQCLNRRSSYRSSWWSLHRRRQSRGQRGVSSFDLARPASTGA